MFDRDGRTCHLTWGEDDHFVTVTLLCFEARKTCSTPLWNHPAGDTGNHRWCVNEKHQMYSALNKLMQIIYLFCQFPVYE